MSELSVAIIHTPWVAQRRAWVLSIRREFPQAVVVGDYGRRGCWPTARRAWLAYGNGTHHLVLADDMEPVTACRALLQGAIEANPEACISPFCSKACTREAVASGRHWAVSPDACYGAATVLPTPWIRRWLKWDREHIRPDYKHDDVRLAIWLVQQKLRVWYTAPSLFEHVGASVGLHPDKRRVASILADGSKIDWSRGLSDPVRSGGGRSRAPDAWRK